MLLKSFGIQKEKLQRQIDSQWGLTFEDMLALYADMHNLAGGERDESRDLVDSVFEMLDAEHHGAISPEEFIRSMREQTDPKHQLTDREYAAHSAFLRFLGFVGLLFGLIMPRRTRSVSLS